MNINQVMVDRVLDLTAFDKTTGRAVFMLTEVEDFQTSITIANEKEITTANGSIAGLFEEGKDGTMSGSASFINFGLMGAQNGSTPIEASADNKIITPQYDLLTVKGGKVTLTQTPVGVEGNEIGYIYTLNNDGTINCAQGQNS